MAAALLPRQNQFKLPYPSLVIAPRYRRAGQSPASSDKTIIIASTEGNVSVPDREEKVGLNVYRKKDA